MPAKKERFDVNPQFLNITVLESGANTFTQADFVTPVFAQIGKDKALVMEILKIWFFAEEVGDFATGDAFQAQITRLAQTAMLLMSDPEVIMKYKYFTSGASGATLIWPTEYDFTDSEGNGILYGSSKIFIGIQGISQGGAIKVSAKILYRLKEVSASELIGIIQA